MSCPILIDYGCHSFSHRLATYLSERGHAMRYFANASLESPNLSSLASWQQAHPLVVRPILSSKPYGKLSFRRRLSGELAWAGECIRALEEETPSAVIVSCAPITVVTRIQNWARRKNIPFIYWLQDLQGHAIHGLLGRKVGLPGRVLGSFAYIWEQQLLDRSSMVITIAAGHEKELPPAVLATGRYALLENWANIEEFPVFPVDNDWSASQGLNRTQNIVYSGTLGLKHDLGVFTSLASAFRQRPDVRIVVVSSGQAAKTLRQTAMAQQLHNLIVLPFQPASDVPKVLASAAVLIAPLDRSAGGFCVPSKVLSYLCAGRPTVIAISPGNPAAAMLRGSSSGTIVEPGNNQQFVAAVAAYLDNPQDRLLAGRSARSHAEATFGMQQIVSKFLRILHSAGAPLTDGDKVANVKLAVTQ
jgi:glycosyltransferase involved in cell wall biosynthesis